MRFSLISWPLALGALLVLPACSGTTGAATEPGKSNPPPPVAAAGSAQQLSSGQPPRNQCNAQAAQFLVGQPYGGDTLGRALAAAGADEVRMLRPDSMITKEYKMGRLNVVVDGGNRVQRVHCG